MSTYSVYLQSLQSVYTLERILWIGIRPRICIRLLNNAGTNGVQSAWLTKVCRLTKVCHDTGRGFTLFNSYYVSHYIDFTLHLSGWCQVHQDGFLYYYLFIFIIIIIIIIIIHFTLHWAGWCQRIKTDFTFDYQYLENEVPIAEEGSSS